jgi:hypothetical protein
VLFPQIFADYPHLEPKSKWVVRDSNPRPGD